MLDMIISIWLSSDATFILGCIVVGTTVFYYGNELYTFIKDNLKDRS